MKKLAGLFIGCLVLAACNSGPAKNPDPNHTHVDFAVWLEGQQVDFSGEQFMSGSSQDKEHPNALHKYLHLHDGNGHVIHSHKPGLTLGEFFTSIGVKVTTNGNNVCMQIPGKPRMCQNESEHQNWIMYVNGERQPYFDGDHVFADNEKILLVLPKKDSPDLGEAEVQEYLSKMTDDACLYSRTCPERGDPPTENCIADPEVPCVIPE